MLSRVQHYWSAHRLVKGQTFSTGKRSEQKAWTKLTFCNYRELDVLTTPLGDPRALSAQFILAPRNRSTCFLLFSPLQQPFLANHAWFLCSFCRFCRDLWKLVISWNWACGWFVHLIRNCKESLPQKVLWSCIKHFIKHGFSPSESRARRTGCLCCFSDLQKLFFFFFSFFFVYTSSRFGR